MAEKELLLSLEFIKGKIHIIRGKKVMLDRDLAELYGVKTKRLNEQVKRNINRFPKDFMFELSQTEFDQLVANCDRLEKLKHSTVKSRVLAEQGVAMLSSVLNSERAIQVNIQIMGTFVKLKELAAINTEILNRLNRHDSKLLQHDKDFDQVFKAIQCLMDLPVTLKRKSRTIGFKKKEC